MDVAYQKCTQILNDDVQKCFHYGETDYLCIFESNRKNKECQDRVSKMREVPKVCPQNSVLNKYGICIRCPIGAFVDKNECKKCDLSCMKDKDLFIELKKTQATLKITKNELIIAKEELLIKE